MTRTCAKNRANKIKVHRFAYRLRTKHQLELIEHNILIMHVINALFLLQVIKNGPFR